MTSAAKQTTPEGASLARVPLKTSAEVEFRGLFKVRLLLGEDGIRRIVPADVASALGLTRQGLQDRVRRRFGKGCSTMLLPTAGGPQGVLTLDLHYLPALLHGIEVWRVRAELRPRLEEMQEKLTAALAAYVFDGVAVNPEIPQAMPPSAHAEFRPVVDGRVGESVVIDRATGHPIAQGLRVEDIVTICAAAMASQVAAVEARFAAMMERMLVQRSAAGSDPGPMAGAGFAREICRDLKIYAQMMAGDMTNAPAIKMWRGKAETALRAQLDFNGRGSAWKRLPETKRDRARSLMETMLDTAATLRSQREREAQGDLFKKH